MDLLETSTALLFPMANTSNRIQCEEWEIVDEFEGCVSARDNGDVHQLKTYEMIKLVAMALICVIGIPCNVLVVYVMLRYTCISI